LSTKDAFFRSPTEPLSRSDKTISKRRRDRSARTPRRPMSFGVIREIGYISLHSSDITRSVAHAQDILGLVETARSGNAVYMASSWKRHHDLLYLDAPQIGVGQIGLIAPTPAALDTISTRVLDAGYPMISQSPLHAGVVDGFAFVGPEGFMFEIYLQPE